MISEHEDEPVPGLPGHLPPGETLLWQGSPDWRVLARTAFHTRLVTGYFALLAAVSLAMGGPLGALATAAAGVAAVALLYLLAWATARGAVYTLTSKRVVLRIGIALPKCINLPLGVIEAVDARLNPDGSGDLPLHVAGAQRIGYAGLWPHARPWKLAVPQPMLRAVPDAAAAGALIARTCLAAGQGGRVAAVAPAGPEAASAPAFAEAAAA